ncbi:MAG: hypothetical protein KJ070_07170 [Verrucomicrobia bacterium]|nr:hypothetical protein [Verrucomicrobiota bacterium]
MSESRRALRQAFTRTELLVVIGVLAIIVALATLRLPSAGKSSPPPPGRHSRSLQCLVHLKQLAAAQHLYAEDHGGRFCPSYLDYHAMDLANVWMGALADYHGQPDGVWLCPEVTNAPPRSYLGTADAPWTYSDPVSGLVTPGSYAINAYLAVGRNYQQAKAGTFKVRNVFHGKTTVRQPALAPAFCDAIYWNCRLEETAAPPRNLYQPQGIVLRPGAFKQVLPQFIARHGDSPASEAPQELTSSDLPGAINMAFVDGHAETVPLESLWSLHWHKLWDPKKVPQPHPAPK